MVTLSNSWPAFPYLLLATVPQFLCYAVATRMAQGSSRGLPGCLALFVLVWFLGIGFSPALFMPLILSLNIFLLVLLVKGPKNARAAAALGLLPFLALVSWQKIQQHRSGPYLRIDNRRFDDRLLMHLASGDNKTMGLSNEQLFAGLEGSDIRRHNSALLLIRQVGRSDDDALVARIVAELEKHRRQGARFDAEVFELLEAELQRRAEFYEVEPEPTPDAKPEGRAESKPRPEQRSR
jgi:hypothetical protein